VVKAVHPTELGQGPGHARVEPRDEAVHLDRALAASVGVGCLEGLGNLVAQADVVHDEAVAFLLAGLRGGVAPVGAGDGLEQRVLPQRPVQVHHLLDRSVEPGEQLGGDDQQGQRIVGVVELPLYLRPRRVDTDTHAPWACSRIWRKVSPLAQVVKRVANSGWSRNRRSISLLASCRSITRPSNRLSKV